MLARARRADTPRHLLKKASTKNILLWAPRSRCARPETLTRAPTRRYQSAVASAASLTHQKGIRAPTSRTRPSQQKMAQTPPQPLRERRCASFGEPAQARSPLPRRASRPRAESDCTWSPKKRALIVVQTSWLQDHEQTCLPRLREIGTEASQGRTRLRVVVDRNRRTTV